MKMSRDGDRSGEEGERGTDQREVGRGRGERDRGRERKREREGQTNEGEPVQHRVNIDLGSAGGREFPRAGVHGPTSHHNIVNLLLQERDRLSQCRECACVVVGADPSVVSLVYRTCAGSCLCSVLDGKRRRSRSGGKSPRVGF
jgi:hypothetical protein